MSAIMNRIDPIASHDQDAPCRAAELLVHVARLVHGASADTSLTPAQWTALRYFASANRFSRTPSAFSEFHATTRGTASQVVKSLISLGFLARLPNDSDGRSALIEVTDAGRAKLTSDPLGDLIVCLRDLPDGQAQAFLETLNDLGTALARRRAAPTFGECGECGHCATRTGGAAFCRCTQSMLSDSEMGALCVDFVAAPVRKR